jgi:hypothetical protein
VRVRRSIHTRRRGGSRETLVKELAVIPWIPPSRQQVTTVIPLDHRLITSLKV